MDTHSFHIDMLSSMSDYKLVEEVVETVWNNLLPTHIRKDSSFASQACSIYSKVSFNVKTF